MSEIQIKYKEWRQTPHGKEVYGKCLDISQQMAERGFNHYSIWLVIGVVRHHRHLESGTDDEGFKVCNNYTPYLSRELMATGMLPDGFFTTKTLKHDVVEFTDEDQGLLSI